MSLKPKFEVQSDLSNIDLNLLVVLNALLDLRNVTHASKAVQISQASTMRSLSRLREIFEDDLLVRKSRSFSLTPFATKLLPKVHATIGKIGTIFDQIPAPDKFSLAMPDHLALMLAPRITGHLRDISPTTDFIPVISLTDTVKQIEDGQLDLAIGVIDDAPSGFFSRALPSIPSLCLSNKCHFAASGDTSISDLKPFFTIRIGTNSNMGFGEVYDGLETIRYGAHDTSSAPDIHTAARLIQDTDAIIVLPAISARYLASRYNLKVFLPAKGEPLPDYPLSLIWHEKWHRDPLHAGIRNSIASMISEALLDH